MTQTLRLLLTTTLAITLGCEGMEGPQGPTGPEGPAGMTGAAGMTGSAGMTGPAGTIDATYLEAASSAVLDGTVSADLIYTSADLTVGPGTWLVTAQASVFTTTNPDAVALGIFDATKNADVPQSVSAGGSTPAVNLIVALTTSKVITLTNQTILRIKAFRNGVSTPHIGTPAPSSVIQALKPQRIWALKLK